MHKDKNVVVFEAGELSTNGWPQQVQVQVISLSRPWGWAE